MNDMSIASLEEGWMATDDTFGARLALIRQRMGWGNVAEAALACGLPVASWRNWERDGRMPRDLVRIARQIADTTGCSYYWLLDGSAGPGTPNGAPQDAVQVERARRDSNPQPSDP